MRGENDQHDTAGFDTFDDRGAPRIASSDIARGYPATYAMTLQRGTDGVGHCFVFGGVRDENIVAHVLDTQKLTGMKVANSKLNG